MKCIRIKEENLNFHLFLHNSNEENRFSHILAPESQWSLKTGVMLLLKVMLMMATSFLIVDHSSFSGFHILSEPIWVSTSRDSNEMHSYRSVKAIKPALICLVLLVSQILELTLLMASYINHWNPSLPSASHQPQGHWDVDSRHFPTMNYTTKGPTLL